MFLFWVMIMVIFFVVSVAVIGLILLLIEMVIDAIEEFKR